MSDGFGGLSGDVVGMFGDVLGMSVGFVGLSGDVVGMFGDVVRINGTKIVNNSYTSYKTTDRFSWNAKGTDIPTIHSRQPHDIHTNPL